MAQGFNHKLNPIQAERAAKAGLRDSDISDARDAMAAAGEFPRQRAFVREDSVTDGLHKVVYFNSKSQRWIYQTDIDGQVQSRFEADTEDALMAQVREHDDPDVQAYQKWRDSHKWGQVFGQFECDAALQLLHEELARLGFKAGSITPDGLDAAFLRLYDKEYCTFSAKSPAIEQVAATPHENLPTRSAPDPDLKNLSTKELKARIFAEGGWTGRRQ